MPGRLVADAFDPAELARRPAAHVRSYELVGEPLAHASAAQADPEAIEEMMANLRALGYVGGSGDEGRPAAGGRPKSTESGASTTRQFYHRNLAVQYIRQGRFADAESELARANEIKPLGKTYEMLSQVRSSQGHYAEAIAALDDGWTRVPDLMNPASILWIVELDLLAGNPAAAKTDSTRLSAHMSPAIRLAIDGRLVEAAGDTPGAIDDYRRALDQDPLIVRTAQRLHDLEIAQGQPFAIEPFLLRTVAAHPEVDAYWDLAGQLALARGENETAVERFRKANALQPDDGLYIGHLASALAASGQPAEARSLLAWADRFPPAEADAWMALGSAWDRLGDPDRAVKAFDAARAAGLRGPGADIGSALALARSGRTQDALRVLDAADARFPSSQALAQVRQRLAR
jgi:tetratricopeptide (TPR) repeat protein